MTGLLSIFSIIDRSDPSYKSDPSYIPSYMLVPHSFLPAYPDSKSDDG